MNNSSTMIKIKTNVGKNCMIPISAICSITADSFSSRLVIELINGNRIEAKYTLDEFLDKVKDYATIIDLIGDAK